MSYSPNAVAAKQQAADWKEAIRCVGALYEKEGIATAEYAEGMIAAVEEFGPYMVLTPGVAMPHAAKASGVKRGGSVVVTLETPVEFGSPANDPVDVLISFAAGDKQEHIQRIKQLSGVLADAELLAAIRKATSDEELAGVFRGENRNGGHNQNQHQNGEEEK